ncbi:MAG: hypothetical protein LUD02_04305 [Tannerellaceae bacterium]|nr:hypothetical protein [Tannerellaceae bacterium]
MFALISVWIRKEVNRIGKVQLEFQITSTNTEAIDESEDNTFIPGNEIRIEAGYNGTEEIIFTGIVVSHQLEIAPGAQATLIIGCCDYAYPATLTRKNRLFEKATDSEAIKTILSDYSNLTPDVEDTTAIHTELVQYGATDWDFILSRADINGWIIITENKDILIKKPVVDANAVVDITYGTDLYSFRGDLDAAGQISGTEAWAWDHTSQELVTVSGTTPTLNTLGNIEASELAKAIGAGKQILQTSCIAEKEMLQNWADARLLKAGLARIRGEVQFQGNAAVIAGCTISLNGLGSRFDGIFIPGG